MNEVINKILHRLITTGSNSASIKVKRVRKSKPRKNKEVKKLTRNKGRLIMLIAALVFLVSASFCF